MTRIGSSDLDVLPINLGANVFGWTGVHRDPTFAILDAFTAGGGDFVDTADTYRHGDSETFIGEWLASRGRDKLVVATKVSKHPEFPGLSPANIAKAVEASLGRLHTDHIDLYYAHFDDPEVPLPEFAGALSELVDDGKVRYIGISNFTPERIEEWFAAVEADGLHAPVALQPHYNLVERDFETDGLQEAAAKHDLGVMPYFALAKGFLTGKYRPGVAVDSPRRERAETYLDARGEKVLAALDAVAAAHGVSDATVALAWLRSQGTIPIASASRVEQLPDLLASATLELTADEIAALSSASA